MTIAEHLRKAHAFVELGWCQHHTALQANGYPTTPKSKLACQWCMMGALYAALPPEAPREDLIPCLRLLRKVVRTTHISKWQDKKGRTQKQVLRVFDKAFLLAETQS